MTNPELTIGETPDTEMFSPEMLVPVEVAPEDDRQIEELLKEAEQKAMAAIEGGNQIAA